MVSRILAILSLFAILGATTQLTVASAETLPVEDLVFPLTVSDGNFSLTLPQDYWFSVVPLRDKSELDIESKDLQFTTQEVYDIDSRSGSLLYGGHTYNITVKGEFKFLLSSFTLHYALWEAMNEAFCSYDQNENFSGSRTTWFNTTIERNTTIWVPLHGRCVGDGMADNEFLKVRVEGPVDSYFYDSVLNRRGSESIRISGRNIIRDWDSLYIVLIPHHMSTSHVVIHISVEKESWDVLLLVILIVIPCAVAVASYALLSKRLRRNK